MTGKLAILVTEWKAVSKATLRGFCTVRIPAMRLSISGIAVHERDGRRWVQLPSRPHIDRSQQLVRGEDGKLQYAPLMHWDSREVSDAFSAAVVRALLERYPGALMALEAADEGGRLVRALVIRR